MKFRKSLLCTLTAGALLFAGASVANEGDVAYLLRAMGGHRRFSRRYEWE